MKDVDIQDSTERWPKLNTLSCFLFLIVAILCGNANAVGWTIKNNADSMTDRQQIVAFTKNTSGHSLSVYRMQDGTVWINFRLPAVSTETLTSSRLPMYRIDKHQPWDLEHERQIAELIRDLRKQTIQEPMHITVEPKWISFKVWEGNTLEGRSKQFIEISEGTSITFRYYLFTGGYAETIFDLTGAGKAIAEATGIKEHLKSGLLQKIESVTAALQTAQKECEQNAIKEDFSTCSKRAKSCAIEATNDVQNFLRCYQQ